MYRNRVAAAIALTTVACTALTGCAPKDSDAVITIDNNGRTDKLTYGYVNFVCKYNQARIDQVDIQYMGKDYWSKTAQSPTSSGSSSSGGSKTNEESAKDYIYQNIQGQYIAKQNASKAGVKLTSDDKKKIEQAAKKFLSDNTDTAIKQVGATQEYIEDYLEYETYYEKVRGKVEAEADDTVTDKEANQSTFSYALFSTKSNSSTSSSSGDSEMSAADKAKLLAKAEKVAAASDFDKEAKAEKADTSTYSYTTAEDPADDGVMDEKVIAAAQKLSDGEVSDVIEVKDRGYYVIRMDKTHDAEATASKKKSLASDKREAAFNKQMDSWKKNIRFTLDKKLWKQIKFTDLFSAKQASSGDASK